MDSRRNLDSSNSTPEVSPTSTTIRVSTASAWRAEVLAQSYHGDYTVITVKIDNTRLKESKELNGLAALLIHNLELYGDGAESDPQTSSRR